MDSLVRGRREYTENHIFYEGDIADKALLREIFKEQGDISSVIHLAAFISVPESVSYPHMYYKNNVSKGIQFFANLEEIGCKNIIFSSSASVYGNSKDIRVTENHPIAPESPYAKTKAMTERILRDYSIAYGMNVISLRYFNPIGADPEFRTGAFLENPSHILGILLNTLKSENKQMTITGVDWPTRDGSGIRDYIHIWDLAAAHVNAVLKIAGTQKEEGSFEVVNIGRGDGVTVRELVAAFEKAVGEKLDVKEGPPRDGDVAGAFAVCDKANEFLGWRAEFTIEQAIRDALIWEDKKKEILIG